MNSLSKAGTCAGGQRNLAEQIGIGQSAVANWIGRSGLAPVEHCAGIERATKGVVTVEQLRPDALWQRIPDPDWPHPDGRPLLDFAPDRPTAQEGV